MCIYTYIIIIVMRVWSTFARHPTFGGQWQRFGGFDLDSLANEMRKLGLFDWQY